MFGNEPSWYSIEGIDTQERMTLKIQKRVSIMVEKEKKSQFYQEDIKSE
jgi:hypothetical protein